MADGGSPIRSRSPSTNHTKLPLSSIIEVLRSSVKRNLLRYSSIPKVTENDQTQTFNGSRTPPPAYSDIRRFSELQDAVPDSESKDPSGQEKLSNHERRSSTSSQKSVPTGTDRGINWKSATQGISFITLAAKQSTTEESEEINPEIARPLYIHAMTYLLRGLPTDMNLEEQLSIRTALPVCIGTAQSLNDKQTANSAASSAPCQSPSCPSILHRILASGIIYLFFFIHAMFPYIKAWMKRAYRYERQHHITEKLVSHGLITAEGFAKKSIELYGSVSKIGHGKLGHAMDSAIIWCIDGVTGGIHEGVGEGLAIMGARSSTPPQPRA